MKPLARASAAGLLRLLLLSFLLPSVLLLLAGCRQKVGESQPAATSTKAKSSQVEIVFSYGSEKEKWIEELTRSFNEQLRQLKSGETIRVKTVSTGSGTAIDEILSGERQAHLVSPASAAFIDRGNASSRAQNGGDLIGRTENLVLSPVVIAMWRPMAEKLGWGQKPIGWSDVLDLARKDRGWAELGHPEWGKFKLGHTHPEMSNSGLIAVFAQVYAATGKVAGLTLEDVAKPSVARYLSAIQSSIVHYGTSTGFFGRQMFTGGPAYLSAAVLYENMVIESYGASPAPTLPVVAIYPKEGTFWSDHPVGIVERPWVTPKHREAAEAYIHFLLERPQQERALAYGFRPADPAIALTAPIDQAHGVDPQQPQTTLAVPSVEVMDAIVRLWHENKKKPDVVLAFDTSGSMQEGQRMPNARDGALQLLSMLHDHDSFSLLPFSESAQWALESIEVGPNRKGASERIAALFPSGGTALYDAIEVAYQHQVNAERADPRRIRAIVVLTDGADTRSKTQLDPLLQRLRDDRETVGVRIFTIGYGAEANSEALEAIAEASQAKFFAGTPENIRQVFFEISTFF